MLEPYPTAAACLRAVGVVEGTDAEVEVCLSHASSSPVSVSWATADGTAGSTAAETDYVAGAGVITWAAGETCVTLTIRTVSDELAEGEVRQLRHYVGPSHA